MERVDVLQTRKALQDKTELLRECLLSVLDLPGVESFGDVSIRAESACFESLVPYLEYG